ncbi:MAG: hypothetical protein E7055_06580 [Lentisphaerae bacterium]|nr:hypothetical protein [Lentisphaerota bacterium]
MEIKPVKGSLTEVRKSCGVKGCKKCASGERHQAYLYMYRKNGKTCSMHVPKYAVEDFRKMLAKGIKAEEELVQNGIDFLKSLRGCAKGRK